MPNANASALDFTRLQKKDVDKIDRIYIRYTYVIFQ